MAISLKTAQNLAEDLNGRLRTAHQLINRTTHGRFGSPQFERLYKEHKNRFIQSLHFEIDFLQIERAIAKVLRAHSEIQFERPLLRRLAVHLVMAKFGIGSDGGMAAQGWIETVKQTNSIFIETTSNKNLETRADRHSFVLLNVDINEFHRIARAGDRVEDVLGKLKNGILFDPTLNYAGPVSEFKKSPISRFNAKWETHWLSDGLIKKLPEKNFSSLLQKVELVYQEAKQVLKSDTDFWKTLNSDFVRFLADKYKSDIGPRVLASLKILYPNVEWEQEIRNCHLVISGKVGEEELEPIAEGLHELGFDAEVKNGVLRLKDPDPIELEKLLKPEEDPTPSCKRRCCSLVRYAVYSFAVVYIYTHFFAEKK